MSPELPVASFFRTLALLSMNRLADAMVQAQGGAELCGHLPLGLGALGVACGSAGNQDGARKMIWSTSGTSSPVQSIRLRRVLGRCALLLYSGANGTSSSCRRICSHDRSSEFDQMETWSAATRAIKLSEMSSRRSSYVAEFLRASNVCMWFAIFPGN